MANVKGTGSTARGRSQKGSASGIAVSHANSTGRASGRTPAPSRNTSSLKPPTKPHPSTAANTGKGSDNESHEPNGQHKATNC